MPYSPECKNCTLFRHEGYSACRECDVAHPELKDITDEREEKFTQSVISEQTIVPPIDLHALEVSAPPYNVDEDNLRLAHSFVKKDICLPFDSEQKKDFYSEFEQAILQLTKANGRKELITREEAVQTYKSLAKSYPRKHYEMFETFKLIAPVIESIFGYSAFRYGFKLGDHAIDGVDKEFLEKYFKKLETMPIFERKELTNAYIKTLVNYSIKRDNLAISPDDVRNITYACIGYYTACYKLNKLGKLDKSHQLKPNNVVDKIIRGEQLTVPVKDERRK